MSRSITTIIWAAAILLLSCSRQTSVLTTEYFQDKLDSFNYVIPECTLLTTPADSISSVRVIDSVVCSFFQRGKNSYAVCMSTLDSKPLGSFVQYGSGWDQMMIAYPSFGSGKIVLRDLILNKITMLSPADVISGLSQKQSPMFKSNIISQTVIPFDDKLLFLNPYSYEDRTPRVLVSDRKWNYRWHKKYNYTTINLNHGQLLFDGNNTIAYVSKNEPVIEFMSRSGHLSKKVVLPHAKGQIAEDNHNGFIEYLYYAPIPVCFTSADSNDNFIITSFQTDDNESVVIIFNWDGLLLKGFKITKSIKDISISNDGNTAFCWETDGGRDYLCRYNLSTWSE